MAGKITALKVQKRNRNRVSVYLDDRFAFGLPAVVAASLRTGQHLSEAEVEALQEEGNVEAAYNRVLDYLSYRPRSQAEVVTYLQKRGLSDAQIEAVTARLKRAGLVDDEEFARFWIENRERFRPRGVPALRYELRSKGIDDDVIDQALAGIDISESAYRAAGKRVRQWNHLDRKTFDRKMVEYLARRGFDYEVAREAARRHWTELSEDQ